MKFLFADNGLFLCRQTAAFAMSDLPLCSAGMRTTNQQKKVSERVGEYCKCTTP